MAHAHSDDHGRLPPVYQAHGPHASTLCSWLCHPIADSHTVVPACAAAPAALLAGLCYWRLVWRPPESNGQLRTQQGLVEALKFGAKMCVPSWISCSWVLAQF
eukprot:1161049-Pelagomonas_calceolata.AAC.6